MDAITILERLRYAAEFRGNEAFNEGKNPTYWDAQVTAYTKAIEEIQANSSGEPPSADISDITRRTL